MFYTLYNKYYAGILETSSFVNVYVRENTFTDKQSCKIRA